MNSRIAAACSENDRASQDETKWIHFFILNELTENGDADPVRFGNEREEQVPGDYIEMIDERSDRERANKTGRSRCRTHKSVLRGHCEVYSCTASKQAHPLVRRDGDSVAISRWWI